MSKVNSKREKLVKAKVKSTKVAVKADKPVIKQETNEPVINSIVNAFIYPNKGKYEIDSVKVNLNGKDQTFTALSKVKLDIQALKLNDLVKQLFVGIQQINDNKFQFGYKNVYGYAFGIVPKGFNSYKAVISHHNSDGHRSIIVNSNKHFGMIGIEKALTNVKAAYENHKTYVKLYVSKENITNLIKAFKSLIGAHGTMNEVG